MRRLALALLVVSGCNQILGLKPTQAIDASTLDAPDAPPDAFAPSLRIARQVLASVGPENIVSSWSASDPPPTLQLGPVGGALASAAIDDQGNFVVPAELLVAPYRIVYELPGDVETEIIWTTGQGTFSVPMLGRTNRGTPPASPQIAFNATPAGTTFPNANVVTSGLWSVFAGDLGVQGNDFSVTYDASGFTSLAGPLGALSGAAGDVEVATASDGTLGPGATGFVVVQISALQGGATVTGSGTFAAPAPTVVFGNGFSDPGASDTRLVSAVGGFGDNGAALNSYAAGVIATTNMLAMMQPVPGSLDTGGFLPLWGPSTSNTSQMKFADPFDGSHAPAPQLQPVAYASFTLPRLPLGASGPTLTSGFEAIGPAPVTGTPVAFAAGLAGAVALGGVLLSNTAADDTPVATNGSATLPLVFGTDQPIDDCVITLYSISGKTLTATHRYFVAMAPTPQKPVPVDTSLLSAGMNYTFAIACRTGTQTGDDFTKPTLPFSESMLYTAVFHAT